MNTESWPRHAFGGAKRTVVNAEARLVDGYQTHFQIVFRDSSGNTLSVSLPDTALRNLAETGLALLGMASKRKAPSGGKKRPTR